jgi:glycosyltransferase involved in cell wall biosynthesis
MANVLLEAMFAGKPVVATDIAANSELITSGRNGLLVPPQDPAAIKDAIERILKDQALANALSTAARSEAEQNFTVEALVKNHAALYASGGKGNG